MINKRNGMFFVVYLYITKITIMNIGINTHIKFRVVFNRSNRLNKQNKGLIAIEASYGKRAKHISTKIYVYKEQYLNGVIIKHPLSLEYNAYISDFIIRFEKIQYAFLISHNRYPSLEEFISCIKESGSQSAKLRDFCEVVMKDSDRKSSTKDGYITLMNDIDIFKKNVCIGDIDYNFIVKYDAYLQSKVQHNTRVGRHHQLRALLAEAERREIISINPYKKFSIPSMKSKKGFIDKQTLIKLRNLRTKISVKQRKVLDGFLFCVATGIRFSDFVSLKNENVKNGWLKKVMIKTGFPIEVPLELFDGLANEIIEQYNGDIEKLARNYGTNAYVNQVLKDIFTMVGIDKSMNFTFHTSRHTCASLLLQEGYNITTVQKMLGHRKISTTQIYGEVTKETIMNDMARVKKNKRLK